MWENLSGAYRRPHFGSVLSARYMDGSYANVGPTVACQQQLLMKVEAIKFHREASQHMCTGMLFWRKSVLEKFSVGKKVSPFLPMCATSKECVQVYSKDEKDGRGGRKGVRERGWQGEPKSFLLQFPFCPSSSSL